MSPTSIINLILVALELLNHFIEMGEIEYGKNDLPEITKSKISLIRAENKARSKYLKGETDGT